ncbi:MAG TPA: BlaI/MecI/CopY family transcriptional regulator [Xanthomonadaceae bacterium]|jgi:predicted transcriptional regulator|nr:BlaI/MecI/CopY family transcriptional regulator [Xanthomonadaceae bacterium]
MAKNAAAPKPTTAELNLLRVIWPLGDVTVKQVHEAAQKERPDMTYATVLRLMQVMHGKGLLTRDDSERSHVYSPAQKQESLRTGLLKDLIHKAFAGSGKELVMAALRDGHVTPKEREEIRKLLSKEDDQ